MIPVTQSKTGENGNCMSACIASILEIPLRAVPNFAERSGSDAEFYRRIQKFLEPHGLRYRQIVAAGMPPSGFHTIEGLSPRGGQHAVVGFRGRMVHDPHPEDGTGRGLAKYERWGIFEPLPV